MSNEEFKAENLGESIETVRVEDLDEDFFQEIIDETGINAKICFTCGTCSGSCPVAFAMDYTPRQIIGLVQLGLREKVLSSKAIWLCASCYLCQVRCPRGVKITEIITALKRRAIREFAGKEIRAYYKSFMENLRKNGRIHESGFFVSYKLEAEGIAGLLGYAPFGYSIWRKGKLSLSPPKIRKVEQVRKLFSGVDSIEKR